MPRIKFFSFSFSSFFCTTPPTHQKHPNCNFKFQADFFRHLREKGGSFLFSSQIRLEKKLPPPSFCSILFYPILSLLTSNFGVILCTQITHALSVAFQSQQPPHQHNNNNDNNNSHNHNQLDSSVLLLLLQLQSFKH